MAIQLNASGATTYVTYDGTASPIAQSGDNDFGFCAWLRRDTDTGAADHCVDVWDALTGSAFGYGIIVTSADNYAQWKSGASNTNLTTATVGSWIFCAYRSTGIYDGTGYYGTSSTLTSASGSVGTNTTLDCVGCGRYTDATSYFKGTIAHFRVWARYAPTQSEFEAEMVSATPVRTSNLYLSWDFVADATDASGNGRTGTITGSDFSYVTGPTLSPAGKKPAQRAYTFLQSQYGA